MILPDTPVVELDPEGSLFLKFQVEAEKLQEIDNSEHCTYYMYF